jgi:hypothetical protein
VIPPAVQAQLQDIAGQAIDAIGSQIVEGLGRLKDADQARNKRARSLALYRRYSKGVEHEELPTVEYYLTRALSVVDPRRAAYGATWSSADGREAIVFDGYPVREIGRYDTNWPGIKTTRKGKRNGPRDVEEAKSAATLELVWSGWFAIRVKMPDRPGADAMAAYFYNEIVQAPGIPQ